MTNQAARCFIGYTTPQKSSLDCFMNRFSAYAFVAITALGATQPCLAAPNDPVSAERPGEITAISYTACVRAFTIAAYRYGPDTFRGDIDRAAALIANDAKGPCRVDLMVKYYLAAPAARKDPSKPQIPQDDEMAMLQEMRATNESATIRALSDLASLVAASLRELKSGKVVGAK